MVITPLSDTATVHGLHVYNAAGNKILWLDGGDSDGEAHFDKLRVIGRGLARRCKFDQEMTAVLFRSSSHPRALFWNPDGTEETVCGNALRCAAHFISEQLGPVESVSIETPHGIYLSRRLDDSHGSVSMPARTVRVETRRINGDFLVDVGTPHRIRLVDREWADDDVRDAIACSQGSHPVNFNLVRRVDPYHFRARIFERGVGETYSCGTGAVAIVAALRQPFAGSPDGQRPHVVEFASGERLNVNCNHPLESIELSGRLELLIASSIPPASSI